MSDGSQPARPLSMRLIFEYEGDTVRLVMQQPVDVLPPGSDVALAQPESHYVDWREGYYVDTQDSSSRTLARVPAYDAFHNSAEVFPERSGEPITRIDLSRPHGAFTVIVPVGQEADHVRVVYVARARPDTAATRATDQPPGGPEERELARFQLHLDR